MQSHSDVLKHIILKEHELGLYDEKVIDVSLWRLFRHPTRTRYLKRETLFNNKSNKKSLRIVPLFKSCVSSFFKYLKLFISKKKTDNVFWAFPRLVKHEGVYLDKFTDPIIEYSTIKKDCLVFQRNSYGSHRTPRYAADRVIESDAIDYSSLILATVLSPVFLVLYLKTIIRFYKRAKSLFDYNLRFLWKCSIVIGSFLINYFFIRCLYKKLKPKRIFLVNRGIFMPAIVAAKRMGIMVYEIQHGVTHAETSLYSGHFDPLLEPDYFLVFGQKWIGPQFNIPLDKMINIGWAYKKMTAQVVKQKSFDENYILVVSSPACTFQLFDLVVQLSRQFPDYVFSIRLHPQEGLTETQLDVIRRASNIRIDDTTIDSAIAIELYSKIIGENSSVLYEALNMGKPVGRLKMGGLNVKRVDKEIDDRFYYISNINEFEEFLKTKPNGSSYRENSIYNEFNEHIVNSLK